MRQMISEQIQTEIAAAFPGWQAVEKIGGGINTAVFRIRRDGEKDQALKIISNAKARQEIEEASKEGVSFANEYKKGMRLNWEREAAILQVVNECPFVVHMYECNNTINDAFGVPIFMVRMELLSTLKDILPTMTVNDAVQMGIDICKAIVFYNKLDIIHCDIKPENIYRDKNGRYKLGDFSSAIYTSEINRPPRYTDLYAAPEITEGEKFGKSIDLYSLGLVLFGLLNGQYPPFIEERSSESFPSEEQNRQSIEIRLHNTKDVGQACQATSELNEILNYACSYKPNDRYENASEFSNALEKRQASLGSKGEEKLLVPSAMLKVSSVEGQTTDFQPIKEHTKNDGPIGAISIFSSNSPQKPDDENQNESENETELLQAEDTAHREKSSEKLDILISGIKDKIRKIQENRLNRKQKKKRIWAVIAVIAAVVILSVCIVLIQFRMNRVANLTVTQIGYGITATWNNGGNGPWRVAVLQNDKTLVEKQVDQRQAAVRLAPGYHYTVRVGEESKDVFLQEMPNYDDGSIKLERVKLQYYRVKTNGELGPLNDTDHIDYSPLIGTEGEHGYQLRLIYKMLSGEEMEAICFLLADRFQESMPVMFNPSEWLQFSDISLNDVLKTYNGGGDTLTFKVYVNDYLLTKGTYDISTE